MSDRFVPGVAFLLAAAIVCGANFVIASKGGQIIDGQPPGKAPPAKVTVLRDESLPVPRTEAAPHPIRDTPPQELPERRHTGIYRCIQNGSVVYSDQACTNGREVDVSPNSGFDPTPVRRPGQQPRAYTQETRDQPVQVQTTTTAESQAGAQEAARSAQCAAIDAEIAQVDAMARAGGGAAYQDWLRDRRHKLVDEKYRLKC